MELQGTAGVEGTAAEAAAEHNRPGEVSNCSGDGAVLLVLSEARLSLTEFSTVTPEEDNINKKH